MRNSVCGLVVAFVLLVCACSKGHKYWGSCDARVGPNNYCEDFYTDVQEYVCTAPDRMRSTPCDRANVLGGCRSQDKDIIRWFYAASAGKPVDDHAARKECSGGGTWVAADWKEPVN